MTRIFHGLRAAGARLAVFAAVALVALAGDALAGDSPANDVTGGCGICHGAERVKHALSVHASVDVGCVACHGGDVTVTDDKDRAHAKDKGFRGVVARKDVPLACGGCHEDVRKMRPFALRTDALAAYRTSHHGRAVLERGETDAAVCTDCHGVHDLRRVRDPLSPANRLNVPATCGRCHGDPVLMKRHGLPSNAPAEYAKSVHGRRLADGEPGVPSCADCHDAHAATPAGATEVANVCGNCHAEPRDRFRESPHFAASKNGRMKQCVTCHGNHAITHPGYALFDSVEESATGGASNENAGDNGGATRCLDCHAADAPESRAPQVARAFGASLREADRAIREAELAVVRVAAAGYFVDEEREFLARARRGLVAAVPLTHACNASQVDSALSRVHSLAQYATEGCQKKVRQDRDRRIFGSAAGGVLLLVSAFLSLRRRMKGKL
ncbi:MAG: cytochrome c3 family protein [Planctomycetes bacterium]|nr:cytochrome c3 family protein [Planctomycetota bacterium]